MRTLLLSEALPSGAPQAEHDVTLQIFDALVSGTEAQRSAAIAALSRPNQNIDRVRLRLIIGDALERDYGPGREELEQDDAYLWARSWMLNVLGRIADDDAGAAARVRRHLDPDFERYKRSFWVQYWVLDSLVTSKAPDLPDLARKILERHDRHDPLVIMLAQAILARGGDADALKTLDEGLNSPELQWATLRALRVAPIPSLFGRIAEIVERGAYSDVTFDAIAALGTATAGTPRAERAARTLANFIATHRRSGLLDGMRTLAIKVLGTLKQESVTPLLIEGLTTDNPTEAREAALALEKLVGVRTAAARVVEAASKAGSTQVPRFARALQWMDREALAEELESLMVSGRNEEQEVARQLLSEIGGATAFDKLRARTTAVAQYTAEMEKAEEKVRNMFETSIAEARVGFKIASAMDIVVFAIGLLLILASAGLVLFNEGKLDSWLGIGMTGGTGALGVLYSLLIARPRRQIVDAVDHLMALKIVFLGYLRQLHQADQAYTRNLLENKPMGIGEVQQFSRMVETTMQVAVTQLGRVRSPKRSIPASASEPGPTQTSAAAGAVLAPPTNAAP